MRETDEHVRMLLRSGPLMKAVAEPAIGTLDLAPGSRGLDAGCGIGLQALILAETLGAEGSVTGMDISLGSLLHAVVVGKESGFAGRMTFEQGDVSSLPFADKVFDWAWSSCCVGYSASLDPVSSLSELARVVRPGGRVAILVWSSEKLLPGYPRLEAHLAATASGLAPFTEGRKPEAHWMRALGWFREAGLKDTQATTVVGQARAPLSQELRRALIALFEMRWPGAEAELTAEDRAEFRRLCQPGSPDFIVDHPDYYALFTCSLFSGRVSRKQGQESGTATDSSPRPEAGSL